MAKDDRKTVTIADMGRGLLKMAPDVPGIIRHAPGLILRSPKMKKTIGHIFQNLANAHPDRPFVRFEGATTSYGEANRLVNRYAAVLTENGVNRGDVVAILAKNSPTDLFVILATVKLGATAGMMNYNQLGDVAEHSLSLLKAKVLVYDPDCADVFDSVSPAKLPPRTLDFTALDV
ncbi:MAG TPA: AMP-binding protein, partial [Gordonia sp. (in: high G+C Gram-positive bacteria)]|nr:AMP-binding protein [Gordonia sp. (in: high G+C Gram-positive bacteria)]